MSWKLVALVLCVPAVAAAEVGEGWVVARQALPASETDATASRVIYLAHDGVTVTPGDNDSQAQRSSLARAAITVPAWGVKAEVWSETVACVKAVYAPFAVTVTDVDPGDEPHIEAIFGGSPALFGMGTNVAGVSPFTADCAIIPSSIVYTFTDIIGDDSHAACQIAAQEIAHSYGLDHELLASDPMTYLPFTGDRAFADQTVACGEYTARPCGIEGSTCRANQNSVALLEARVGAAGTAPTTAADPTGALDGGCSTAGGGGVGLVLLLAGLRRSRR